MSDSSAPTAAVLIIGNEILSGRTQDANLNTIARKLGSIGIRLVEARVVADMREEIAAAVNELRKRVTYLLTTGGIGPTHDDITAESVAFAFGVEAVEHPEAKARLVAYYTPANINPGRLRMARVPEGAVLIDNPVSAAPGFRMENVYVLAGVPKVMEAMLDHIAAQFRHGPAIHSFAVSGAVGESIIADDLRALAALYPRLDIGSYPWFRLGKYGTSLVARGTDRAEAREAADKLFALLEKHGGKPEREVSPSAA